MKGNATVVGKTGRILNSFPLAVLLVVINKDTSKCDSGHDVSHCNIRIIIKKKIHCAFMKLLIYPPLGPITADTRRFTVHKTPSVYTNSVQY